MINTSTKLEKNHYFNLIQTVLFKGSIVLLLLFYLFLCTNIFATVITIDSVEELQKIGNDPEYPLNEEYELNGDIDGSDTINWNEGFGFKPIGSQENPFVGRFNGNGYKIANLYINRPLEDYVGLFGFVGLGGEVKNVGVGDCQIVGGNYTGGLIGYKGDFAIVSGSYSMGYVEGAFGVGGLVGVNIVGIISDSYSICSTFGYYDTGGLVGYNDGLISLCYSNCSVSGDNYVGGLIGRNDDGMVSASYSIGLVEGNYDVGGLIGYNDGTISDSYSTSSVEGSTDNIGGLVGWNESGTISNCYSIGLVRGSGNTGGLIGLNEGDTVSNSYWDTETSEQTTSAGGEGKTTAEMKQQDTFVDWDFTGVWVILEEVTYPLLCWFPYPEYKPEITLLGDSELTIECGSPYGDAGATAYDIPDGDLTSQIQVSNNVNSDVVSDYTVEYVVTDSDGNTSSIATRLVHVTDTTAPEITLNGDNPMTVECGSIFVDPGAEVTDTCDSEVNVEVVSNNVDTSQTGTYYVVYYAVDDNGNSSEKTREVTVDCAGEGTMEGSTEGTAEGTIEGTPEGIIEGIVEGTLEGSVEGEILWHSADPDRNGMIDLGELLRVIQFFNMGGYHCKLGTEDGYAPGFDGDKTCASHASDYDEQDWTIDLGELLRLIQFFNMGGYYPCPGMSEDNYCPGIG